MLSLRQYSLHSLRFIHWSALFVWKSSSLNLSFHTLPIVNNLQTWIHKTLKLSPVSELRCGITLSLKSAPFATHFRSLRMRCSAFILCLHCNSPEAASSRRIKTLLYMLYQFLVFLFIMLSYVILLLNQTLLNLFCYILLFYKVWFNFPLFANFSLQRNQCPIFFPLLIRKQKQLRFLPWDTPRVPREALVSSVSVRDS